MHKTITIPDEWVPPLERLAARKKTSLSRLLCDAAFAQLPAKEQAKLPAARGRGRVKKTDVSNLKPLHRRNSGGILGDRFSAAGPD